MRCYQDVLKKATTTNLRLQRNDHRISCRLRSRSLRSNSPRRPSARTLCGHTKWNTRLKCVEIGSCSALVDLEIGALLHMVRMKLRRRLIFLTHTKRELVNSSILIYIALMGTGVSSCTHKETLKRYKPTPWSSAKMHAFQRWEPTCSRMETSSWVI